MAERRLPWLGAAGSVALASFIAFGGVRLYRAQLAETLDSRGTEIAAIAELKIWELLRWRLDRTADARTAADTLAVLSAGQSERAPGGASREPLTALLESLRRHQTIEAAAIVEPSGKVLLSVGIAPGDLEAVCRELLAKREPVVDTVFTDLLLLGGGRTPFLGIFQPLRDGHLLYLQIDPGKILYPIIRRWPTPSPSGEVLLVRREGDSVLYLNELRHRAGTALRLKLPASDPYLPAARAVSGFEGLMTGDDYRGVEVLAVTRRVPGAAWFIVAKLDRDEALGPLQARSLTVALIAVISWLLVNMGLALVWRQRTYQSLRRRLAEAASQHEKDRQSKEALSESEQRYRELFQNMAEGMALCRIEYAGEEPTDFTYIQVNPAFERLTGLAGVEGRRVSAVLPGHIESDRQLVATYDRVVKTGASEHLEYPVAAIGRWLSISVYRPLPGHFCAVFGDVSGRKRMEAALALRLAELGRSNEELNRFAYIASHDLQEPLRAIASFVQLLERDYGDRLDDRGREFIGFAVDGANRLQAMIEGLLAYERIGSVPTVHAPVDLGAALAQARANLAGAITATGAVVTCDPLPTVPADRALLVQLFQLLVDNAVKYRGDLPPRIHVSCSQDAAGATVRVEDNGIGVAPRQQQRIFEVFRRLHGPGVPGSGIGLSLCRRIVELFGGKIWVESEPGRGAAFSFTLPMRKEDLQ